TLGMHTNPAIPPALYDRQIYYVATLETAPIASWRQRRGDGPLPGIFADEFTHHLQQNVAQIFAGHSDKPLLLGYCYSDIPWWEYARNDPAPGLKPTRHPWVNAMLSRGADTASKRHWIAILRDQFPTPGAAAAVWGLAAETWGDLA